MARRDRTNITSFWPVSASVQYIHFASIKVLLSRVFLFLLVEGDGKDNRLE